MGERQWQWQSVQENGGVEIVVYNQNEKDEDKKPQAEEKDTIEKQDKDIYQARMKSKNGVIIIVNNVNIL